jgi:hypothetical protein
MKDTTMTNPKIDRLWKAFTGRYGAYQLKDGQHEAFVKRSWEVAFGDYPESELMAAATHFMGTSKYERWPSTGDFKEALALFHVRQPRDEYKAMSEDWKRDLAAFCDWWETIPLFITRGDEPYVKRDEVFADFMAGERGKFGVLAVKAWRRRIWEFWGIAVNEHMDKVARTFRNRAA